MHLAVFQLQECSRWNVSHRLIHANSNTCLGGMTAALKSAAVFPPCSTEPRFRRKQSLLDSLVDDQVRSEAEHAAVALFIRAPTKTKGHEEEPGALQQSHLVIQIKVAETCKRTFYKDMSL